MQQFYTIVPRYVGGKYVNASPDFPALVEFPDDLKVDKNDRTLIAVGKGKPTPPEKEDVVPHFAKIDKGVPKNVSDNGGRRPSDVDPA